MTCPSPSSPPTDSRLRRLGEEKNELEDQLRRLKLELEEERHMSARARISGSGGGAESDQVQREVARQVGEYRFKLQKSDQDITNLQTAVSGAQSPTRPAPPLSTPPRSARSPSWSWTWLESLLC